MSERNKLTVLSVICGLVAFATVWLGAWFLREGPSGRNAWAFLPVVIQTAVSILGCAFLGIAASAKRPGR